MTVPVVMNDPATGNVAIFDEAPGGGSFADVNALCNRPLVDPENWLPNIHFHTALDRLEILSQSTVSVVHALVNASGSSGYVNESVTLSWFAYSFDRLLVTHGLGVIPDFMVAQGVNIIWPGFPIQTFSDGRGRFVSVYATTTEIRMFEWASVTSIAALPTVTLPYVVLIFKPMAAPSGAVLLNYDPLTDTVQMDYGRFDSSKNYLQVVSGGTPFGMAKGRTIDLANGAPRYVRPDGTTFEPVPATMQMRWTTDGTLGLSMAYNGGFTGTAVALVQAP